jgi:hypothetical protein
MHVGHARNTSVMTDDDVSKQQKFTDEEKYLGIIVAIDVKPPRQCVMAAARAMSVIGLIGRHFKYLDKKMSFSHTIHAIRTHAEHCMKSGSPDSVKDIECLENVQRKAIKLVAGLEKEPYES